MQIASSRATHGQAAISLFLALSLLLSGRQSIASSSGEPGGPGGNSTTQKRVDNFQERLNLFQQICLTDKGALYSTVTDPQGTQIDCVSEAKALNEEKNSLQEALSAVGPAATAGNCLTGLNPVPDVVSASGTSLSAITNATALSCSKNEAQSEESSCLKQVGCNVLRSALSGSPLGAAIHSLSGMTKKIQSDSGAQNSCLGGGKSDCITEAVAGILKDLWSNISGIWDLAKMAGTWAKDKAVNSWGSFWSAEDASSDKMLAASQQSESTVSKFIAHPGQMLQEMGEAIYKMIADAIQEKFMCAQWSGEPHLSTCLKPQKESWQCASCDQKLNAACGVIGMAGGEILAAYLTGGSLNLLGKAGKATRLAEIAARVAEAFPKTSEALGTAAEVVRTTASATVDAAGAPIRIAAATFRKAVSSDAAQKLAAALTKLGSNAGQSRVLSGAVTVASVAGKAVKIVTSPVTAYLGLMDDAFKLGSQHGEHVAAAVQNAIARKSISTAAVTGTMAAQDTVKVAENSQKIVSAPAPNAVAANADINRASAEAMQDKWQKESGYVTRPKPIDGLDKPIQSQADLDHYTDQLVSEGRITPEMKSHFRFIATDSDRTKYIADQTGKAGFREKDIKVGRAYEDIQKLPNSALSPANAGENLAGADAAGRAWDRTLAQPLRDAGTAAKPVNNVDIAAGRIENRVNEAIHNEWYSRNSTANASNQSHGAGYVASSDQQARRFTNLSAQDKVKDLDVAEIAFKEKVSAGAVPAADVKAYEGGFEKLRQKYAQQQEIETARTPASVSGHSRAEEVFTQLLSDPVIAKRLLRTNLSDASVSDFAWILSQADQPSRLKFLEKLKKMPDDRFKKTVKGLSEKRVCVLPRR
jgi:hypothetical protein